MERQAGSQDRGECREQQLVRWRALTVGPSMQHMNGSFTMKYGWAGVSVCVCVCEEGGGALDSSWGYST